MKCSKPGTGTSYLFKKNVIMHSVTENQSRVRLIGTMQETLDYFLIHVYTVVEVLQQEDINVHLSVFS